MSVQFLLFIGALALLDMFSPAVIGVTLYVLLAAKEKRTRLVLAYVLTVMFFYFGVGIFLMLGLDAMFSSVADWLNGSAAKRALAVSGAILFLGSWFVPKKKPGSPKPKSFKVGGMAALGFTTSLIEVATALPYFAAIGIMTSEGLVVHEWLPLLAGYNVVMILPALVLLGLSLLFSRFMQKPMEKLQSSFERNTSSALSWTMCIVGIIMLANSGI